MNKTEYAMEIAKRVNGEIREVEKLNGIKLTGITIKGDTNVTPTIYIDKFYEDEMNLDEATELVLKIYENKKVENMDLSCITDFEKAKEHLRIRMLNGCNNHFEIKRQAPKPFDDLIIVPYLENIIENGSTKVTGQMIETWEKYEDDVFKVAITNTSYDKTFRSMSEVLSEMIPGIDVLENGDNMYVCSNTRNCFGASSILFENYHMHKAFPEGCYIIPSSVHEVIVVPLAINQEELDAMINEVNESEVAREDFLSDHAYKIVFD